VQPADLLMPPLPHPLGPVTMETSLVSPGHPRDLPGDPVGIPQAASNSQQVSLSLLIEFLVQRVYHELTVLVRRFLIAEFHDDK
jgi:hypothetical protein